MNREINFNFKTPAPDAEMNKLIKDCAGITDPVERRKIANMSYLYFLSDKNKGNFESSVRNFLQIYNDYKTFIGAGIEGPTEALDSFNKLFIALETFVDDDTFAVPGPGGGSHPGEHLFALAVEAKRELTSA